jgi:hypothetical protein
MYCNAGYRLVVEKDNKYTYIVKDIHLCQISIVFGQVKVSDSACQSMTESVFLRGYKRESISKCISKYFSYILC